MQNNTLGSEFYEALSDTMVLENAGWVGERVRRVEARLQPLVGSFNVVVPWMDTPSAFTLPGDFLYITRQLFELRKNDDMVAFICAHEIAHHDLGHIRAFPKWMRSKSWMLLGVHVFHRMVLSQHHARNESDADTYAIDLCAEAGYDVHECVRVFDVLEKIALDRGDVDSVMSDNASYPSIRRRKREVLLWHASLR